LLSIQGCANTSTDCWEKLFSLLRRRRAKKCPETGTNHAKPDFRFIPFGRTNQVQDSGGRTNQQTAQYDETDTDAASDPVVFTPVTQNGPLLSNGEPNRILFGSAGPTIVNRFGCGQENDAPASFPAALTPINIFGVEEKPFIKEAEFVESGTTSQPEAADQNIDIDRFVTLKVEHMFAAKKAGVAEDFGKPNGGTKIIPKCGISPARTLMGTVGIQDARADHSDVLIFLQIIHQNIQTFSKDFNVRIQNENIFPGASANTHVVATGKADVFFVLDDFDCRKAGFNKLWRPISGSVINDDGFHGSPGRSLKTLQKLNEMLFVVPAKNNYRDFGFHEIQLWFDEL
jgi:hypothetical protein